MHMQRVKERNFQSVFQTTRHGSAKHAVLNRRAHTDLGPRSESKMTLDQKIQVWVAVGTWVAGLATLAAVIVALHLARRTEKVRLQVFVGLRVVVIGDGSPFQEHLSINVTNLGERSVTINTVGWVIGKRKQSRYCIQPVSGPFTTQFPVELAHRQERQFHGVVPRHAELASRLLDPVRKGSLGSVHEDTCGSSSHFGCPDYRGTSGE